MTKETIFLIAMLIILLVHIVLSKLERTRMMDKFMIERQSLVDGHNRERSELLDRLQANSFTEYKHMEIATIKATEKKEVPQPQYEYEEV